jgi:hypothetical protein
MIERQFSGQRLYLACSVALGIGDFTHQEQIFLSGRSMVEIVNLMGVRKARARVEAERKAAHNRSIYGQSRAEKERSQADRRDADKRLDQHWLGPKNQK